MYTPKEHYPQNQYISLSRYALSSKNVVQATYVILNFLVVKLKGYKETGELILAVYLFKPLYPNTTFQHVTNRKINEICQILFLY